MQHMIKAPRIVPNKYRLSKEVKKAKDREEYNAWILLSCKLFSQTIIDRAKGAPCVYHQAQGPLFCTWKGSCKVSEKSQN